MYKENIFGKEYDPNKLSLADRLNIPNQGLRDSLGFKDYTPFGRNPDEPMNYAKGKAPCNLGAYAKGRDKIDANLGEIQAPGGPTDDMQPAMVSNKEAILTGTQNGGVDKLRQIFGDQIIQLLNDPKVSAETIMRYMGGQDEAETMHNAHEERMEDMGEDVPHYAEGYDPFAAKEEYAKDMFKNRMNQAAQNRAPQTQALREVYPNINNPANPSIQERLTQTAPVRNANAQAMRETFPNLGQPQQPQAQAYGIQDKLNSASTNRASQSAQMRVNRPNLGAKQDLGNMVENYRNPTDKWAQRTPGTPRPNVNLKGLANNINTTVSDPAFFIPAADTANQALLNRGLQSGNPGATEAARLALSLGAGRGAQALTEKFAGPTGEGPVTRMFGRAVEALTPTPEIAYAGRPQQPNAPQPNQQGFTQPPQLNDFAAQANTYNPLNNPVNLDATPQQNTPQSGYNNQNRLLDDQGMYTARGDNGGTAKVLDWNTTQGDSQLSPEQYQAELLNRRMMQDQANIANETGVQPNQVGLGGLNGQYGVQQQRLANEGDIAKQKLANQGALEQLQTPQYEGRVNDKGERMVFQKGGQGANEFNTQLNDKYELDPAASYLLSVINGADRDKSESATKNLALHFPTIYQRYVLGNQL